MLRIINSHSQPNNTHNLYGNVSKRRTKPGLHSTDTNNQGIKTQMNRQLLKPIRVFWMIEQGFNKKIETKYKYYFTAITNCQYPSTQTTKKELISF